MKYNYTEMKENEHSYDNFDLRTTNEVPAVYVRSKVPEDNGKTHASDKRSGTKKKAVMDDEHIQIRDELLNN